MRLSIKLISEVAIDKASVNPNLPTLLYTAMVHLYFECGLVILS